MKKEKLNINALTARELANFVKETNTIPVPIYTEKDARPLIVQSRSIWDRKRIKKRTKKPIEF